MKKNIFSRVGSEEQYGPRIAGALLHDYLENSNEPLAVAYRESYDEADGWHANTELGCDLKTLLRSDKRVKVGKSYVGVLRCDLDAIVDEFRSRDPHYTFIEAKTLWVGKRNLRLFDGKFISVTRQDNGSLRLNFKKLEIGENFSVEKYALGVYNEICIALGGLLENG